MLFGAAGTSSNYIEVFNHKDPKDKNLAKLDKARKIYEQDIKSYIFETAGITLPALNNVELGLKQQFIVFQVKFPEGAQLNFEIVVKTQKNEVMRLLLSSAFKEYLPSNFHLQIPFDKGVPRNAWLNLCFDVGSLLERENMKLNYIKSISVKGQMKLRRIFTQKFPLSHFQVDIHQRDMEDDSLKEKYKLLLPKEVEMAVETYNIQVDNLFVAHHQPTKLGMTENQSTNHSGNMTQKDTHKNAFGVNKNGTGQTPNVQAGLHSPVPTKTFDIDIKTPKNGANTGFSNTKSKSTTKNSQSIGRKPSDVKRTNVVGQNNIKSPNPNDRRKQIEDDDFLLITKPGVTEVGPKKAPGQKLTGVPKPPVRGTKPGQPALGAPVKVELAKGSTTRDQKEQSGKTQENLKAGKQASPGIEVVPYTKGVKKPGKKDESIPTFNEYQQQKNRLEGNRSAVRGMEDDDEEEMNFKPQDTHYATGMTMNGRFTNTGENKYKIEDDHNSLGDPEVIEEESQFHGGQNSSMNRGGGLDISDKFNQTQHFEDFKQRPSLPPAQEKMFDKVALFNAETPGLCMTDSLEMGSLRNKGYKPAQAKGYAPPVRDVNTFVQEILSGDSGANNMRPFSPPASNIISLVDPNKTVVTKTKDKTVVMNYIPRGEDKQELHYDVALQCYVDPKTNEYYAAN